MTSGDVAAFDERFVWNEYIVRSLLDFRDRLDPSERRDLDRCQFIVMEEYGAVHAINLLGSKENEQSLTTAYGRHLQTARGVMGDDLAITHFDFHNVVKFGGHDSVIREMRRLETIVDHLDRFGFTMCNANSDEIITEQKGVFRTNCLDCLDRTNFVQDILSRMALEQYLLLVHREWTMSSTLWSYHRELWAENGDALSKIYAGTGALNTSFTRSGKRTLAGP
ncbi:hypothetical protein C0992_004632 [Termitomyces sp. T32_za158]|nr:hypothetical protein C0992_004632 [Termitomyces sp. T32_za158]